MFILLASSFCGCNSTNSKTIYGKYTFNKVIYISPLSSTSIDYINKQMSGTEFIIEKDKFEIVSSENPYKIMQPNYIKEKMDDNLAKIFNNSVLNTVSISSYKDKYQYSIFTKNNEKIKYYIYSMNEELWLSSYNTANNKDTIMYIFKLK